MNAAEEIPMEEQTPEDLAAIAASFAEGSSDELPPLTVTVLRIWQEILGNIEESRQERISPTLAARVVRAWSNMTIQEVPQYWALYYDLLESARTRLHNVLSAHPDAIDQVENDAEENREVYLEVAFEWNDLLARMDEQWNCTDPEAHLQLAALTDVAGFLTGPNGLFDALSQPQVGFEFTEADQAALAKRLGEAAAGRKS